MSRKEQNVSTTTQESELLELERSFWKALQDRDVEAAIRLTDFPCIVVGPQGVGRIDRQEFAAMARDPRYTIEKADLTDVQVRLLREDVAVVAYRVHEELVVEGRPVSFDAADSSTWIRRDGRWLCAAHAEGILGDPFGRDRRPAR